MSTLRIGKETFEVPEKVRAFVSDLVDVFTVQNEVINKTKIAVPWMVKSLAVGYENEGMFSDELKHAISLRDDLEKI